jgi:hypothetical protein
LRNMVLTINAIGHEELREQYPGRHVNSRKLLEIYDPEAKTHENCSKSTHFLVRFLHRKLDLEFQMFIDGRMHW